MKTVASRKLLNYLYDKEIRGKDFAKMINVSQAQVSKYICGLSVPRINVAFRIKDNTNGYVDLVDWIAKEISEKKK